MKNFTLTLTDTSNQSGVAKGRINGQKVTCGRVDWFGHISEHTESAEICVESDTPLVLTGDAWREIESNGCFDNLVLLLQHSKVRADKVVSLASNGGPYYRTIMTRDAGTESCTAFTTTDDENEITDGEEDDYLNWELNEGNPKPEGAYLGGGSDDIEECDLEDVVIELLADASREAEVNSTSRALDDNKRLAEMLGRCVSYLADLNGSNWIRGDDAGSVDMRQRAKGLQSAAFAVLGEHHPGFASRVTLPDAPAVTASVRKSSPSLGM